MYLLEGVGYENVNGGHCCRDHGVLGSDRHSHAVPNLGVGSSFGYVNATDPYQMFWGTAVPGPAGEDGFVVGPSGSALHVYTNITGADIYILTTADVGVDDSIRFNGGVATFDVGVFRSYAPTPYYGVNLGKADAWASLPSDPFVPGVFRYSDVAVTYTGTLGVDQWIFAAADTNGLPGLQAEATREWVADTFTRFSRDDSSPKTTSARGWQVPEAGALLLFGTGLIGLVGYRRARRMQ